jgi:hypothetical protein
VQFAPPATLFPHVFVCLKSLAFIPVIEIPVILTVELLLLLNVIFLGRLAVLTGWFPKLTLLGVSWT